MKLVEFLKEQSKDQMVKIGALGGTGFFYCGTAGEFLEGLETIDKQMESETETAAEREKRVFLKYVLDGFKWEMKSPTKLKRKADESFEEWTDRTINEATEAVNKAFNGWLAIAGARRADAIEAEKIMVEKISIGEREVKDTFAASSIVEPVPTLVIMIYGWEYGKFWMTQEANATKVEKAKESKK